MTNALYKFVDFQLLAICLMVADAESTIKSALLTILCWPKRNQAIKQMSSFTAPQEGCSSAL